MRKNIHGMNQGSGFLGGCFSNRNNVKSPILFQKENQPRILKDDFFLRTGSSISTSIAPLLLNQCSETN